MAIVHDTTMQPTKLELLSRWLPTRSWFEGGRPPVLAKAGGFRIDDPAGEVGIEFMFLTDSSGYEPTAYAVPMTYRGAPLDGGDAALIGKSEHGVLGTRWIYDATRDPVFLAQVVDLLAGRAIAQDQNASDTPDSSVRIEVIEIDTPPPAFEITPVDDDRHTEIDLGTGVLVLHRVPSPADITGLPGHVHASWTLPDGEPVSGIVLHAVSV
ncbi:1,4-alpha-glucan branching protein [Nocardia sp. NPDC020380]|uniref:maltokinase N-terminal cap-like domain-containing protein n=1 Tax=Nocardia sp. NPDC020380 TaxID=3364309 RepID=UPI00378ED4FA